MVVAAAVTAAVHHPEEVLLQAGDARPKAVNKKGFRNREEKTYKLHDYRSFCFFIENEL
jgi:hypothetical protein